jgi:hypothetical protein
MIVEGDIPQRRSEAVRLRRHSGSCRDYVSNRFRDVIEQKCHIIQATQAPFNDW